MLATIRGWARSLPFKVLMGLLVISFAVWGIGDIFTGRHSGAAVAEVGDERVDLIELDEAFTNTVRRMQIQTQTAISRQDAIDFGILEQTLQSLVAQRLLDAEALSMGVTVADETVARLIAEEEAFRRNGEFDRAQFDAVLQQNGLNEEMFVNQLRGERTRDTIAGAMRSLVGYPAPLRDALVDYLATTRSGSLLVVGSEAFLGDVPAPTDNDLKSYLEANELDFQVPELRTIDVALLGPDSLIGEIAIDPAEVEAAYAQQKERYTTPERRLVRQLRGDEQAPVEDAYQALLAGEDVDAVAQRIDGVAISVLGDVTEDNLPATFAMPIFAASEGRPTPPVESSLGWHVFVVDTITPEVVTPFSEVRTSLETTIKRERAVAQLPSMATALDDEVGAGTPLAQAARNLGIPVEEGVVVDRDGFGADGAPVAAMLAWPDALEEAFALTAGETSLLEETDEGSYFVVHLTAVEPQRRQTVDEARTELEAAWREAEANVLAAERAQSLLADLPAGDFTAFAAENGLELRPVPPTNRAGTVPSVETVQALFANPLGGVVTEPIALAEGAAVLVIDSEEGVDGANAIGIAQQVDTAYAGTLLAEFETRLRAEHPIRVDRALIDQAFTQEPAY